MYDFKEWIRFVNLEKYAQKVRKYENDSNEVFFLRKTFSYRTMG